MSKSIYSIGHSNHSIEKFLNLLKDFQIEVLVDIRSYPYSKYSSQFDMNNLKESVKKSGMKYLYMGGELGGKPQDTKFYDRNGNVIYSLIAQSLPFLEGISRLEKGLKYRRVAIMCSEENPGKCHRSLLVGQVLTERSITIFHIRGDGRLQTGDELIKDESNVPGPIQLSLF